MANIWMVRAGERGRLIEAFAKGYVAIERTISRTIRNRPRF